MLRKSPLAPLCLSMTGKGLPKRVRMVHLYYLNSQLTDYYFLEFSDNSLRIYRILTI